MCFSLRFLFFSLFLLICELRRYEILRKVQITARRQSVKLSALCAFKKTLWQCRFDTICSVQFRCGGVRVRREKRTTTRTDTALPEVRGHLKPPKRTEKRKRVRQMFVIRFGCLSITLFLSVSLFVCLFVLLSRFFFPLSEFAPLRLSVLLSPLLLFRSFVLCVSSLLFPFSFLSA